MPRPAHTRRRERLRSSIALLLFGLGTLAFLIAIDRPEWFHLHPASAAAEAMSHAAMPAPERSDG